MKQDNRFKVLHDRSDAAIIDSDAGEMLAPVFYGTKGQSAEDMALLFLDLAWSRGVELSEATPAQIGALKREIYQIVDTNAWDECRTNSCQRAAFAPATYCCAECEEEGKPEYEANEAYYAKQKEYMATGLDWDKASAAANDDPEVKRLYEISDEHDRRLREKARVA